VHASNNVNTLHKLLNYVLDVVFVSKDQLSKYHALQKYCVYSNHDCGLNAHCNWYEHEF